MLKGIVPPRRLIGVAGGGSHVTNGRDFPSLTEARGGPMFLHNSLQRDPEVPGNGHLESLCAMAGDTVERQLRSSFTARQGVLDGAGTMDSTS
jgi:hypothetical protein